MSAPRALRVLGFGKHPEFVPAGQAQLRSLGYDATVFTLTNDADGDAQLIRHLQEQYDAVIIGGYINGQGPDYPPSEETYLWFSRLLNIIIEHGRGAKIVLARNPPDAAPALLRTLGGKTTV